MANKTESADISLAGIGEKLKKIREHKSLTIDQAQRQTHIHQTVLLAMEDGRCDEILTPTYVKSFLKKYSDYLGLDSNQILKEYASLHPVIDSSKVNISIDKEDIKKSIDISGYVRLARNAIIIIACILLAILAVKLAASFISASRAASPRKIKNPGIQKTAASTVQFKKGRAPSGARSASMIKQPEKPAQKVDEAKVFIPENEPIKLMMTVKDQVYVGVKIDGEVQFKRQLPKGTIETFTAKKILNISIARAKSVDLVLNGKPFALSGPGQIEDLEITRKGFKVR
jgi:cytoskeletal protein RodZ